MSTHPDSRRPAGAFDVYVDLGSEPVRAGRASFRSRGATLLTEFTYADDYIADAAAYPLAPGLPFQRAAHVVRGLPGPFADTSPDWWGRNLIARKLRAEAAVRHEPPPLVTEVDYLAGVSDRTRQGALRFLDARTETFVADTTDVPRLVDLPEILVASQRVAAPRSGADRDVLESEAADLLRPEQASRPSAGQEALELLLRAGTATLGGARPKASVVDGATLAIAKFPHPHDEWDVMAWEKTALDLAQAAGIRVPARRLEQIGGRSVLLLDRFDRASGTARHPAEVRLGYISALTLLNAEGSAGHDYVDLSAAVADHSADADSDLVDLWRRIAFSVAIHNTDDHMRNHGFLHTAGGWRLSPAFDVNPNPELAEPRSSAVLGAVDVRSEAAALLSCAAFFGLSDRGARVVLGEVVDAVSGWENAASDNGIDAAQRQRFAPMFGYLISELRAA